MNEQAVPLQGKKPPLVLSKSQALSTLQDIPRDFWGVTRRIIECPIYEVRLAAIKSLATMELRSSGERLEDLYRALQANQEDRLAAALLSSYLSCTRGEAFAPAVEFALTCDGEPHTARWLSKDICYKLIHQWYSADDLFTAIPSLAKYLQLLIWGLDCTILRENKPEYVHTYHESCWVEAKRAIQVLVRFATASRAFLPQLETIQLRMKRKLINPDEEFGGNRNPRMVRSLHLTELRYAINDIRSALKRQEREQRRETSVAVA